MADIRETGVDKIVGSKWMYIYTGERKYINKIHKFMEQYPNDIILQYENPDGSIGVKMPSKWFRFPNPPTKRNLTDEQKEAARKRMQEARSKKE